MKKRSFFYLEMKKELGIVQTNADADIGNNP